MPQYQGVTPNTQLRYPVNQVSDAAEESYQALWSQQQFYEVKYAHGEGVISGTILANGNVSAGEWLVNGFYVRTTSETTPSGRTNGATNYIVVKKRNTSWWDFSCDIIAQTSSVPPSDGLIIGRYDVAGDGAISNIVNSSLQIRRTNFASYSGTSSTITNGLLRGEAVDITFTHPQVGFDYSEFRASLSGVSQEGYRVFVDDLRTTPGSFVVVVMNISGAESSPFSVTATRQGTAYSYDLSQSATITVGSKYLHAPVRVLFAQTSTVAVQNTTTETDLLSASVTLPAHFFVQGRTVRITARGIESNIAAPGTLRLRVYLGTAVVLDTGSQTPPDNLTNRGWRLDGEITCRSSGGSGSVMAQGFFTLSTSGATGTTWDCENTTPQTVDTTASMQLRITAQWGTADAGNALSATNVLIEAIN